MAVSSPRPAQGTNGFGPGDEIIFGRAPLENEAG